MQNGYFGLRQCRHGHAVWRARSQIHQLRTFNSLRRQPTAAGASHANQTSTPYSHMHLIQSARAINPEQRKRLPLDAYRRANRSTGRRETARVVTASNDASLEPTALLPRSANTHYISSSRHAARLIRNHHFHLSLDNILSFHSILKTTIYVLDARHLGAVPKMPLSHL